MRFTGKRILAVSLLLGLSHFRVFAAADWSPYPLIGRDTAVAGISVSDKRVLAASRTNLYELDEVHGIWKPAGPFPSTPFQYQSLVATSSAHFLVQGSDGLIIPDGPIPATLTKIPYWFQSVSEDSARFYLRIYNGNVAAADKAKLSWDTLNFSTLSCPCLSSSGRLFTTRHDLTADGLYQSDDRGKTWIPVPTLPESYVSFVKPIGGDLYAGFDKHGIFHSADGGSHWSPLFQSFPYARYSFADIEVAGDSAWLVTPDSGSQGVLRTVNAGLTWGWYHQGMPGVDGPGSPRNYPALQLAHGAGALWTSDWTTQYRSVDGGRTWTAANDGLTQTLSGSGGMTLASSGYSGATWGPSGFIHIGGDFCILSRVETGDGIFTWSESGRKWTRDASYPNTLFTWVAALGDTVYVEVDGALLRRAGAGGAWKSVPLPWKGYPDSASQQVAEVFRLGPELALVGGPGGPYFSDDGGNTWDVQRYFFPKALFQGSKVEARGQTLCWPDDSTHTPPKAWRDFPEPIRGMWVADGKLLVRAGASLYSAATAGGAWTQARLPDTAMALGLRNGALNGYTLDSIWTYSQTGGWQSRPVVFPRPEAQVLGAGPLEAWAQTPVGFFFRKRNGEAGKWRNDYGNLRIVTAEAGSYLMVAQGGVLDTFNIARQTPNLPIYPPGIFRPSFTTSITGLLGDGNFMAEASGKTDLRISLDRGRTWSTTAKPPGSVSKLAGTPDHMFALADSILYVSADSAKTWVPLTAMGPKFLSVAGSTALLVALPAEGRHALISEDTARSWTALPALPSGGDTVLTDVAVQGGQVLVGTRDAGAFIWGEPSPIAVRPRMPAGRGVPARTFRREWIHVPGQGSRLRVDPNTEVDARGRLSIPPKAARIE